MPSAMQPPTLHLQVDELVLDYLLWHCTQALLRERTLLTRDPATCRKEGDLAIKLAHTFYASFKHKYPSHSLPEPILIRLREATFTTALLRRVHLTAADFTTPTSQHERAERWLHHRGHPIIPDGRLPLYRTRSDSRTSAAHQPAPPNGAVFGDLTLRDALWEFMILSAHTAARHEEVSTLWIQTAVEFMSHACVEAYLTHNTTAADAINEAYSYGLNYDSAPLENIADTVVNELFAGGEGEVEEEFEKLRKEALGQFCAADRAGLEQAFVRVKEEYAYSEFEQRLVSGFLTLVVQSQGRPTLAQLEQGKLEGYRQEDVREMLANAGVDREVWDRQ